MFVDSSGATISMVYSVSAVTQIRLRSGMGREQSGNSASKCGCPRRVGRAHCHCGCSWTD
nr:hypothetical protein JVH1_3602 [Rhodococcus sp. JVH1]